MKFTIMSLMFYSRLEIGYIDRAYNFEISGNKFNRILINALKIARFFFQSFVTYF